MTNINYADLICTSVTMPEVINLYGFDYSKKGMCCPFHSEKTPSLKVYGHNKKWKCFGCGEGGSVIDFVMLLFNLDFKGAIAKIDYDFKLNLPINKKPTYREQAKMRRVLAERKALRRAEKQKREQSEKDYWEVFDEYLRLETNKNLYAPKTSEEKLNPLFVEALQKLSWQEYLLDMAEIKRGEADGRINST